MCKGKGKGKEPDPNLNVHFFVDSDIAEISVALPHSSFEKPALKTYLKTINRHHQQFTSGKYIHRKIIHGTITSLKHSALPALIARTRRLVNVAFTTVQL